MSIAYIGIGSNLGNRQENCSRAAELLTGHSLKITRTSSLYETEPWGLKDQPSFINLAIEVVTSLLPVELLELLKKVEREMGRQETLRWGPRIIDLDILLYDDLKIAETDLVIPHPFMHARDFVLRPLAEIAPDAVHPVLGMAVREILRKQEALPAKKVLIYGIGNPLYRDDGLGNRVIEILSEDYRLPDSVRLVEAGSLTDLLDFMHDYDAVIIVDTIMMGMTPGKIVSFGLDHMSLPYQSLSHATGFLEGLKRMKERPEIHFICIEPEDISLGTGLTSTISDRVPVLLDQVISTMASCLSQQ